MHLNILETSERLFRMTRTYTFIKEQTEFQFIFCYKQNDWLCKRSIQTKLVISYSKRILLHHKMRRYT